MQGRYEDNVFSGANALGSFDLRTINTELSYQYNELATPFVRLSVNDFRSDTRIKYQNLTAGSELNLSPTLKVKGGAGVAHISTSGDNEGIGFINIDYTGQRSVTSLSLSRELFPTADDFIELGDNLRAAYTYEISSRNKVGSELTLTQNKFSGLKTQDLGAFYQYTITPQWVMQVDVAFGNIKGEDANSSNNESIGISLTYNSLKF